LYRGRLFYGKMTSVTRVIVFLSQHSCRRVAALSIAAVYEA
jgi:hypothetical protein